MSAWAIVENPATSGVKDRARLKPECHDRSRFLTIICDCGYAMHIHETQIPSGIPNDAVIASRCHQCGSGIDMPVRQLRYAISEAWT